MNFNDDESIPLTQQDSSVTCLADKAKLTVFHKNDAPLDATNFSVLLELTSNGFDEDISGLDIVTVLDVSGSMEDGNKLQKLKFAMKCLIKRLGQSHRLSIVTFSSNANRICPLLCMTTQDVKDDIGRLIDGLSAYGGTNMAGGLQLGLQVIQDRTHFVGRASAILLVSDGDQGHRYEDAAVVQVGDVPVFTFGFGKDCNPQLLYEIAMKSNGGTYTYVDVGNVESLNNLVTSFSQCLNGLLNVVVQDLKLSFTKVESYITINKVSAEYYPLTGDDTTKIVSFGHLYNGETLRVLVELDLPEVNDEIGYEVLRITYSYSYDGETIDTPPVSASIVRTKGVVSEEKEEVTSEKKRLEILQEVENAKVLAEENKFDEAQNKIKEAQESLEALTLKSNTIQSLEKDVNKLLKQMESQEVYTSTGRHITRAILTSHYRQQTFDMLSKKRTVPNVSQQ